MTRAQYAVELTKVIVAYGGTILAFLAPLSVSWWLGYMYYLDTGSRFTGAMAATALSIPAVFVGVIFSSLVARIFLFFWGRGYE